MPSVLGAPYHLSEVSLPLPDGDGGLYIFAKKLDVPSRAHEAMVELETLPAIVGSPAPLNQVTVEFHTTQQPPVTLPPNSGSVLRVVPEFTMADAKKKAKVLRSEILEPAGLIPSNGMGNSAKISKYLKMRYQTEESKMTLEQWKEFFDWADKQSPAELVRIIDEVAAQ